MTYEKNTSVTIALLSTNSFAADNIISKSAVPTRIVVAKAGTGLGQFPLMSFDFSGSHRFAPKKLKGISWRTTYYPDNLNKTVQLCYTKPDGSGYDDCRDISPNSSDSTEYFNKYSFDKYARFTFRHEVRGGKNQGAPLGKTQLSFTTVINRPCKLYWIFAPTGSVGPDLSGGQLGRRQICVAWLISRE